MISIIIPTYNEEKFLGTTLQKLRGSLRSTPYEIIVSDGGSTDRTVAIAQSYGVRICRETEPAKRNIARGRNLGASAASGKYLVFIDADVWIPQGDAFFKKAMELFEADENLQALTTRVRVLPDQEMWTDRCVFWLLNAWQYIQNTLLGMGSASGEFQMIRSEAFHAVKGFDEALIASEDFELFLRLSKRGRTRFVYPLVIYHSGRRAHAVGWFRLLSLWTLNGLSVYFLHRSFSKQWKPIRGNDKP